MQAISLETSSTQVSTTMKRSAPLDPQVADRLLDLLSTDDAFHKLFSRDPREALPQAGFVNTTELASPHFCFWGITKLASKEEIAAARKQIRTMLTSGLAQTLANPGRRLVSKDSELAPNRVELVGASRASRAWRLSAGWLVPSLLPPRLSCHPE